VQPLRRYLRRWGRWTIFWERVGGENGTKPALLFNSKIYFCPHLSGGSKQREQRDQLQPPLPHSGDIDPPNHPLFNGNPSITDPPSPDSQLVRPTDPLTRTGMLTLRVETPGGTSYRSGGLLPLDTRLPVCLSGHFPASYLGVTLFLLDWKHIRTTGELGSIAGYHSRCADIGVHRALTR
jgi:hypothetical protein